MNTACTRATAARGCKAVITSHTLAAGYFFAGLTAGALLIPSQAAAACPDEPRLTVAVVAEHHPLVMRSSYSFAQLREFAASAGYKGPHAPFGFYAGTFGYSVEIRDAEAGQPGCKQAVRVQVSMTLGSRLIEVGTDIPCRRDAVLSHYQRHAEQDDTLLSGYARRALVTFDRMSSAELLGTQMQDKGTEAVTEVIRSIMDRLLQPYDLDRKAALAAADTDAELLRLSAACGRKL